MLNCSKPLSSKTSAKFFWFSLKCIGIGFKDVEMCTGHFITRGLVQLYRILLGDEQIMEVFQMKGFHAHENYCAAYNDCAPSELPSYTLVQDYVKHVRIIFGENHVLDRAEAFLQFFRHF